MDIILGNNLAEESVWQVMIPAPIVTMSSVLDQECRELSKDASYVVMRSKTKMLNETVSMNNICVLVELVAPGLSLLSKISHAEFIIAQRDDPGLKTLIAVVLPPVGRERLNTLSVMGCFCVNALPKTRMGVWGQWFKLLYLRNLEMLYSDWVMAI